MLGGIITLLILLRNAWLYWNYSIAIYPDTSLYVQLGSTFFKTGYIPTSVTFPYPFLNALTNSSKDPTLLIWVQMIFGALAGGFFVFTVARKNIMLAIFTGVLLLFELVSGALLRSILTDGLFATLNLLVLGILLFHYDRRERLPGWELFLAGILLALAMGIRPSNIFLAALFPPLYLWMTRSWKKTLSLAAGMLLFFLIVGLINLKGNQKFYVLASGDTYTGNNVAFLLFLYQLYSPENGPASKKIDEYIRSCYPGFNYSEAFDRSEGGAFDTEHNLTLMTRRIFPCVDEKSTVDQGNGSLFPAAYVESLVSNPVRFAQAILREASIFLKYGNPYILRTALNQSRNYRCSDLSWCNSVSSGKAEWDHRSPLIGLYEKTASKVLQIYLAPVGLFTRLLPEKQYSPYLVSWAFMFMIAVIFTRGRERLLAISSAGIILYTALIVVAGLGYTERYAAMLSPLHAVFSGLAWMVFSRLFGKLLKTGRFRAFNQPKYET